MVVVTHDLTGTAEQCKFCWGWGWEVDMQWSDFARERRRQKLSGGFGARFAV